jgi:hypothetical protein
MTGEDPGESGAPQGEAKRRNSWILAAVAVAGLIAAVVLVLVSSRGETPPQPTAGATPASEPTSPTTVVELSTDPERWVGVESPSGDEGCWVQAASVACSTRTGEFNFPTPISDENHPAGGGHPANIVTIRADGDWVWSLRNLSLVGDNVVTLVQGITYRAHGWTIEPTREGLTVTNDKTGRGMFVSIDRVEPV